MKLMSPEKRHKIGAKTKKMKERHKNKKKR